MSVSDNAVQKLVEKDKSTHKDNLLSLIPEGQSPKLYIDLVKSQVLGTTKDGQSRSNEDLIYFLYVAKKVGLDPLAHQIYAVFRWDSHVDKERMTIQTGIDGLRLIAQRSGNYAGQDEVVFDPVDESLKNPIKASVTVYKMINGTRVPFTATARWSEYVQIGKSGEPMGLWSKMPYLMLGKCAESLVLRKAFPSELSGIYSDVEMQQSNNILADLPAPTKKSDTPDDSKSTAGVSDKVKITEPPKETEQPLKENPKPEIKKTVEVINDVTKMREKLKEMKDRQHQKETEQSEPK